MELTSEIETFQTSRVQINFQSIHLDYFTGADGKPELNKVHNITLNCAKTQQRYQGTITLIDNNSFKEIAISMKGLQNYEFNSNLVMNEDVYLTRCLTCKLESKSFVTIHAINIVSIKAKINSQQMKSLKGHLDFRFKSSYETCKKLEFENDLHRDIFHRLKKNDLDMKIICHGKTFDFNKNLLCSISDVFERMVNNSYSIEGQSGTVEINDFLPKTIESFQKMVFSSEPIAKEEMSVDLVMFANKYGIYSLTKIIVGHLLETLNMDNIYEIMEAAYLIENEKLLKACASFVKANLFKGLFKDKEKWNEFQKAHPACGSRILSYIMFNELD